MKKNTVKMQPKVSIIVPIYGVEKYLHQCVDSILAQTLKDIEIILVDDGSKDKCPQIVDEYAKKDKRIVAVHQPNGGYGRAVNHGIELATGEYMGIVEPDDWIEPDMYETLYKHAKQYDVDVVKGPYNDYFDNPRVYRKLCDHAHNICPEHNPFNIYEYPMPLQHHASIWTGLYRLKFIKDNGIQVLEKNKGRYADQNWRYETLMLAKNIYWENQPFYNYRLTNENASSFKKNNPDDVFDIYIELDKFLKKHPQEFEQIKEHLYIEIYRHMFWNLSRVDQKYSQYCLNRIHKVFQKMDINVVKKSKFFSKDEKNMFIKLSDKNYAMKVALKKLQDNIFSIKKSSSRRHKILTVLGIKFKWKNADDYTNKYSMKLFFFFPLFSLVQINGKSVYKIFGIPVLKKRKMANSITTKYYLLGIPFIKVSKKIV